MSKNSHPHSSVKDTFGDKSKLVSELESFTKDEDLWVNRMNASKGLAHVSNSKLLKLHKTFTAVKEKFGTRVKLIAAIAELEKRAKDEGYKTRLAGFPVPRLWDLFQSATKRNAPKKEKVARKAAAPAPKAEKPAAAKKTTAAQKPAKKKKK